MKTEQIFCDICGERGAQTQKKDAKSLLAPSGEMRDKMKLKDGQSTPYFCMTFAMRLTEGGIEEIDLCNKCKTSITMTASDQMLELFQKAKKKPAKMIH